MTPSTASVPITVLLYYDGPLLCGFDVAIKGLNDHNVICLTHRTAFTDYWTVLDFSCSTVSSFVYLCLTGYAQHSLEQGCSVIHNRQPFITWSVT